MLGQLFARLAVVREVPASVQQRLLSLLDHYRGGASTFNEQVLWRIQGPCDVPAVQAAVDQLVRRHESLRTTFKARGPRLTQVVHPPQPVAMAREDVSAAADPALAAREHLSTELVRPIDLAVWPMRPTLLRLGPADHLLAITMHHQVTDDWSNSLVARDVRQLYAATVGDAGAPELPAVPWQYADWSTRQHELLAGAEGRRLTEYWQTKLAGAKVPRLPARPAPDEAVVGERLMAKQFLDASLVAALQRVARANRTTLFPVVLGIFCALLHQTTDQTDVAVASLFANRSRPEVRDTVGFFVSMLLLRCRLRPGAPFTETVAEARATVLEAMRHQDLPYQLLPPGTVDTGDGRADDVTFQYVGSMTTRADMVGVEYMDLQPQLNRRRFALEFVLIPKADGLSVLLLGARERLDQDWADHFVRDYVTLAAAVAADPERSMTDLMRATV
jgi:hypothetical protein